MRARRIASPLVLASFVLAAWACSDDATPPVQSGPAGSGGSAGGAAGSGGTAGSTNAGAAGSTSAGAAGTTPTSPPLAPGELCDDPDPTRVRIHVQDSTVFVAPGASRNVRLVLQPDACAYTPVSATVDPPSLADVKLDLAGFDLRHASAALTVTGKAAGKGTITVVAKVGDQPVTRTIALDVRAAAIAACAGTASGQVVAGGKIGGSKDVAFASVGLQARADQPATTSEDGFTYATPVIWSVQPFEAQVSCAADILPAGHIAVGSAVTFGPVDRVFPREIPFSIPIEPSALPAAAKGRHLAVSFTSPQFPTPRIVPVGDARVVPVDGGASYVLSFVAPRLGTYQAVVKEDAGAKTRKRRLTHRALVGISMGGAGVASFGFRHHDKFDVLAPLGGPVDWTYMLDQIEHNQVAGFLPNDGETVPTGFAELGTPKDPYEHRSQFNRWWYEYPRSGNGGSFDRASYTEIFRDLGLQFGNPVSQNDDPLGWNLPAGVDPMGKSVIGDRADRSCAITASVDDPEAKKLFNECPAERCKHTQVFAKDYFDGAFNKKGKWPVITVCDGAPQDKTKSPYANTWSDKGNDKPLEVALAVDYNNNGKRDENEPLIIQGHEPWQDVGLDGLASKDEPGYVAGVNEDPAGDDYDAQYNPGGTERDLRYQVGEPFEDIGTDNVPGTKASPYDHGEGDGAFTLTKGALQFFKNDSHSILRQWETPPAGPLTDDALSRVDVWTDGGNRDLFNFAVSAQHLLGQLHTRRGGAASFTGLQNLPGQDGLSVAAFDTRLTFFSELPSSVMLRYGAIDPTVKELDGGSGQHVGTADEVTTRLQTALYYIGSRWPDAPHTLVEKSNENPAEGAPTCEIKGTCNYFFTDSRGRKGPVTVNLPPGYQNVANKDVRYPVIFMMHGYGQTPEDLGAAITFIGNWMNSGADSVETRLSKAIMVYVDGRCRIDGSGQSECLNGTFYVDGPGGGAKLESWMLEMMSDIDSKYRTMGESEVDWPE
jgi:hypothetical protein